MNDLKRILVEHPDMEVHLTTRQGKYEAILRNDAGDVCSALDNTMEGALSKLETEAARAFALEADVWPG